MTHNNALLTTLLALALTLLGTSPVHAQFADCSTGRLQMPTAEMQEDGTFMITNSFLNRHSLPTSGWNHNTFQEGIGSPFPKNRFEMMPDVQCFYWISFNLSFLSFVC